MYASLVLFDNTSSRSALSGLGNDGQRFAQLQPIIHTNIGREELGKGMTTVFCPGFVDNPESFPPEFWKFFLQFSLTALGDEG